MALYPTPPGRRIAYDVNGAQLLAKQDSATAPTEATPTQAAAVNSESNYDWSIYPDLEEWGYVVILLTEPHDLTGIFTASSTYHGGDYPGALEISTDTTNGFDGTWTQLVTTLPDYHGVDQYRNGITPFNGLNAVGVRFRWFRYIGRMSNIHLYGKPSAGATVDRLQFLDPNNADAVFDPLKDWGDTPQGQTQETTFKVKNLSATLTANSVDLTTQSLTGSSYSFYEFSTDNITFLPTVDLGNIAPQGEVLVYLRQSVPVAAVLGPQVARIKAQPTTWS